MDLMGCFWSLTSRPSPRGALPFTQTPGRATHLQNRVVNTLVATLALSWLLTLPTHAQEKQSDREHDQLLGQVESVRWEGATVTNRSGQLVTGPPEWLWTDTYDLAGNIILRSFNNGDKFVFSYDSAGNKTSREYIRNSEVRANPGVSEKSQDVRLDNGTVVHNRIYKYKYDRRGLRTEESIYAENGSLVEKTKYSYDAKGNRIQSINVQNGSSQVAKAVFIYGDTGKDPTQRNLHVETHGGRGALDAREFYQYKYDAAGNWIRRITARGYINPDFVGATYRIITYHKGLP